MLTLAVIIVISRRLIVKYLKPIGGVVEVANQLAEGAQSLTEGATDQASSVEELQSTIDTVSEQVQRNAENANTANEMARVVGDDIVVSNTEMQQVVQAMDTINEKSQQIRSQQSYRKIRQWQKKALQAVKNLPHRQKN